MTPEKLLEASETLGWLTERLCDYPELKEEAVTCALGCTMARMVLAELAKHMIEMDDPYEALAATVRGDAKFSQSQTDLLRSVIPQNIWAAKDDPNKA